MWLVALAKNMDDLIHDSISTDAVASAGQLHHCRRDKLAPTACKLLNFGYDAGTMQLVSLHPKITLIQSTVNTLVWFQDKFILMFLICMFFRVNEWHSSAMVSDVQVQINTVNLSVFFSYS